MPSGTALPCMCASFRRVSRALTQVYDHALRPLGLRVTQFTVLQALSLAGEVSQGELGQLLVMNSTTLTRTLRLLRAHGWIEERPGEDRRERFFRLSTAGHRQLKRAAPRWEALQEQLRSRLGVAHWNELLTVSTELSHKVTKFHTTKEKE
ncbi:MAG TPA: MarR family winged helix-turn-helix transcriptional regulator [Terriglobales bacterium]|nr:MarR family winged helix-turn-helix transcriptional regulator [Terriglobales bacterium]